MKRLVVLVFGVALLCIYGSEFKKISEFTASHNDNIEGRFIKLSDDNVVIQIEVVADNDTMKDGVEDEATGVAFLTGINGWNLWKST